MGVPKFLQPYVPSYNVMDLNIGRDKDLLITQVLNQGNDRAVKWIFKTYSTSEIRKLVRNPTRGMWYRRSLNYWAKILDVKIPEFNFELAVIELNNLRPKLYEKFYKSLDVSP